MGKRFRSRKAKFVLAMLVGSGCVLFAEVALRFSGIGFPRPYIPDQHIGTRLQPGFRSWFGKEGGAFVEVNSDGFRDVEHGPRAAADELRIAVLGDSYVEAVQVDLQHTFWKQLERELNNGVDSPQATVMGFGVSGFGTAQALLTFRHYVKQTEPDIVVLAMTLTNDVRNNSKALEPTSERPFFVLDNDQLVLDDSFLRHPVFVNAQQPATQFKTDVVNASRLLQLLSELKNGSMKRAAPANSERGLDASIYSPSETDEWREAWDVTERLVQQLNEEVAAANARLIVMTVTDGMQVHPDETVYSEFCQQLGVDDLDYADQRIKNFCIENEIPIVSLANPFRAAARKQQLFLHGFSNTRLGTGHWNQAGHRMAAEFLQPIVQQVLSER